MNETELMGASNGDSEAQGAPPEPFEPTGERGVLAVFPHPDDESFAVGGTLARCSQAGVATSYLCGTYGDMGRRLGRPAFTNREALRDVRTTELKEACAVLGCEVHFLGLRDKCVEFEDPAEVADRVRAVIEELQPSTVFTFYPGHGVHPDHDALGHATVLAVRSMPRDARPRILATAVGDRAEVLKELGSAQISSDIRSVTERKLDALRAHRSQTEVMFAQWDSEEELDDQAKAFRDQFTKTESFYLLDPDARTLLEQSR